MNIKQAELVMNIARENSQITGTAVVYGAPRLSLDMDHIKGHVDLVAQTPPSESLPMRLRRCLALTLLELLAAKLPILVTLYYVRPAWFAADLRGTP